MYFPPAELEILYQILRSSKLICAKPVFQKIKDKLFRRRRKIYILKLFLNQVIKNWDGAESKTRPSNLPDINLKQSELTRDTYFVRVNPHKSSSNSRK
jgi:hypothetical protein